MNIIKTWTNICAKQLLIRSLVGDHHHWTWRPPDFLSETPSFLSKTPDFHWRPKLFIGGIFIGDPNIFVEDPNLFIWNPKLFVLNHKFSLKTDPRFLLEKKWKLEVVWGLRWKYGVPDEKFGVFEENLGVFD